MKNALKLFGITALFSVIAFSLFSCGDDPAVSTPQQHTQASSVYTWTDTNGEFELTITEPQDQ